MKTSEANKTIKIALPWSLTHYIPLNGFHPLYRALFDNTPEHITLNAWDNQQLFHVLSSSPTIHADLLGCIQDISENIVSTEDNTIEREYADFFYAPNRFLTEILPGDIEFHHTAPYPSLTKPFIFHCESFAPIFIPFAEQGSGDIERATLLQSYYQKIFSHTLCLGIFSHIPETLENIRLFFNDSSIEKKLFSSKIGLSANGLTLPKLPEKGPLSAPSFLFINSAHQNVRNFFHRGGHIVLEFWKQYQIRKQSGRLIIRCSKPNDIDLQKHGVDIDFLNEEIGRSIIWIEDYLTQTAHNALIAAAHFFLLPSASLHSVSIMQSMLLGTIPIVTDTIGTDRYVTHGVNGIILKGVREDIWHKDDKTGLLIDKYQYNPGLNSSLATQLLKNVIGLLEESTYEKMHYSMLQYAKSNFSGESFSKDFFGKVTELYIAYQNSTRQTPASNHKTGPVIDTLLGAIKTQNWSSIFESSTQPMRRINVIHHAVFELAGTFVYVLGNAGVSLHHWSPVAQYFDHKAPRIQIYKALKDLKGIYLYPFETMSKQSKPNPIVQYISKLLIPYPVLRGFGFKSLYVIRKLLNFFHKKQLYYKRYRDYLVFHKTSSNRPPDVELMMENIDGYNIVRYFHQHYGISQQEGPFDYGKAVSKNSSYIRGRSVDKIYLKIRKEHNRRQFYYKIYSTIKYISEMRIEDDKYGAKFLKWGQEIIKFLIEKILQFKRYYSRSNSKQF